MEKRSTTMRGKTYVFTFLGVICTVLAIALIKDIYATEAIYSKIIFEGFICGGVVAIMAIGFIFFSIECFEEKRHIQALKPTLNGEEYVPIQPKKKLPKDFQDFKKKFKINFLDFYTAEARMDEYEYIHIRIKDKNDKLTDKKFITANEFSKYFQVS